MSPLINNEYRAYKSNSLICKFPELNYNRRAKLHFAKGGFPDILNPPTYLCELFLRPPHRINKAYQLPPIQCCFIAIYAFGKVKTNSDRDII